MRGDVGISKYHLPSPSPKYRLETSDPAGERSRRGDPMLTSLLELIRCAPKPGADTGALWK